MFLSDLTSKQKYVLLGTIVFVVITVGLTLGLTRPWESEIKDKIKTSSPAQLLSSSSSAQSQTPLITQKASVSTASPSTELETRVQAVESGVSTVKQAQSLMDSYYAPVSVTKDVAALQQKIDDLKAMIEAIKTTEPSGTTTTATTATTASPAAVTMSDLSNLKANLDWLYPSLDAVYASKTASSQAISKTNQSLEKLENLVINLQGVVDGLFSQANDIFAPKKVEANVAALSDRLDTFIDSMKGSLDGASTTPQMPTTQMQATIDSLVSDVAQLKTALADINSRSPSTTTLDTRLAALEGKQFVERPALEQNYRTSADQDALNAQKMNIKDATDMFFTVTGGNALDARVTALESLPRATSSSTSSTSSTTATTAGDYATNAALDGVKTRVKTLEDTFVPQSLLNQYRTADKQDALTAQKMDSAAAAASFAPLGYTTSNDSRVAAIETQLNSTFRTAKAQDSIDATFALKTDLSGYAKAADLSLYALKSDIPAATASSAAPIDLSSYALKSDIPVVPAPPDLSLYALKSDIPVVPAPPDLSPYALKSDVPAPQDLTPYARKSDIPAPPDLAPYAKKSDIPAPQDLTPYAKKSDIPAPQDLAPYAKKTDIPVVPAPPDLSPYALKSDIPVLSAPADLSIYALKSDIPVLSAPADLSPYALKSDIPAPLDLSVYAKKSEIPVVPAFPDLSPYAFKSDIPAPPDLTPYAFKSDIPAPPDLTPYAFKSDIPVVPAPPDLSSYAKKSDIPVVPAFPDLTPYALKSDIPASQDLTPYALKSDIPVVPAPPDLSPYALKSDIPALSAPVDLSPFALKSDIPVPQDLSSYAKKTDLSAFIDATSLTPYAKTADLAPYALTSQIPAAPDLSPYALKTDLTGYALASSIPAMPDLSAFAKTADLSAFAKTSDLSLFAKTSDLTSFAKTTDLAPYAKTTDLATYAKTTDLAPYAKTTDLAPYAKTADVASTYMTIAATTAALANLVRPNLLWVVPSGGSTTPAQNQGYSSVASALAAATVGQVVMLAPGTYLEGPLIIPAGVEICGTSRENCIIKYSNPPSVTFVKFIEPNGLNCKLTNLTVNVDIAGQVGVIMLNFPGGSKNKFSESFRAKDVSFTSNHITNNGYSAIKGVNIESQLATTDRSIVQLTNCSISIVSDTNGTAYGIFSQSPGDLSLDTCRVRVTKTGATTGSSHYGIFIMSGCSVYLYNCQITGGDGTYGADVFDFSYTLSNPNDNVGVTSNLMRGIFLNSTTVLTNNTLGDATAYPVKLIGKPSNTILWSTGDSVVSSLDNSGQKTYWILPGIYQSPVSGGEYPQFSQQSVFMTSKTWLLSMNINIEGAGVIAPDLLIPTLFLTFYVNGNPTVLKSTITRGPGNYVYMFQMKRIEIGDRVALLLEVKSPTLGQKASGCKNITVQTNFL